jgi:hypothetical protein
MGTLLGIGILTTAQKQKKITPEDEKRAIDTMCQLNDIGSNIAKIEGINAITDVTGFGLGGHLSEVCLGSGVSATINYNKVPILPNIKNYLANGCSVVKIPIPKGLVRYILSPTLAVEFSFKCLIATLPVTAKPKMGSGASMDLDWVDICQKFVWVQGFQQQLITIKYPSYQILKII